MTTEEAIHFAKCLKHNWTIDFNDMEEFCDMAIKALSEPSGDTEENELCRAYSLVFQELQKCSMFTGLYDAKNGSRIFMDGVSNVMESIAYGVSEEVGDAFTDLFIDNMVKCEKSAEAEPSLKAIKRQIDEHWYLDPPSAEAVQGWIPCSERLPEPPIFCLVTTDGSHNDIIDIALYMSDGWHKASEVIAWMPLPKPYKGGAE